MQSQSHETHDDALRALVIEQFPQARLTFEIVQALQKHLPFTSLEQVQRAVQDVKIGGFYLDAGTIERFASKELLPIKDTKDLIHKAVGLLNIALQQATPGSALPVEAARLVAELARAPGSRRPPIPTVHFVGPSIFGSTAAEGA